MPGRDRAQTLLAVAIELASLMALLLYFTDTVDGDRACAWWRSLAVAGTAGAVAAVMRGRARTPEERARWMACLAIPVGVIIGLTLLWLFG